ncbi:hypothetical protein RW1_040_00440 [Rhodococcus wratislaviensis NBRC 100605]|uniref:HTH merR-type domain-containing protein n=1 Tax=Rhodococcus wratislaviensis NBRC 100605 TaxID=1219028 RepID=X0Q7G3_RHOWR|nr:hypothetical protein RW1_040_00440 [Rhodococcus wratislaviensis NBRC 100605]
MPRMPELWVNADEAARIVKRTPRTIRSWSTQRLINARNSPSGRQYEVSQLLAARDAARDRRQYGNWKPGPGRPPHPARPRIAELLAEGWSVLDIADHIGCTTSIVRTVQKELSHAD